MDRVIQRTGIVLVVTLVLGFALFSNLAVTYEYECSGVTRSGNDGPGKDDKGVLRLDEHTFLVFWAGDSDADVVFVSEEIAYVDYHPVQIIGEGQDRIYTASTRSVDGQIIENVAFELNLAEGSLKLNTSTQQFEGSCLLF